MTPRLSPSIAVIASIAAGVAAAAWFAGLLWKRETARSVAGLHERIAGTARPYSSEDLVGLPAPVARYFEFALEPGQPLVRTARLRQVGEFAMRAGSWSRFTAVEHLCADPPGFVWDAKIRIAPMLSFYIRDGYVRGEGALYGTLAAIVPVVNQHGTPVMASGELLRYLAEAVWLPTALLPRNGVSWKALDDDNARLALADGEITVACDVTFSERGEITKISALRYRAANGAFELTPWVGRWSDYRRVAGMMIPMAGEVEWVLPEGPFSYWRGRVVDTRYEFAT